MYKDYKHFYTRWLVNYSGVGYACMVVHAVITWCLIYSAGAMQCNELKHMVLIARPFLDQLHIWSFSCWEQARHTCIYLYTVYVQIGRSDVQYCKRIRIESVAAGGKTELNSLKGARKESKVAGQKVGDACVDDACGRTYVALARRDACRSSSLETLLSFCFVQRRELVVVRFSSFLFSRSRRTTLLLVGHGRRTGKCLAKSLRLD